MKLVFLGTRGEIEEKSKVINKQSGLLINLDNTKLLIDIGEKEFLNTRPDYILITHSHPDHLFIAREKEGSINIPIVCNEFTKKEYGVYFKKVLLNKRNKIVTRKLKTLKVISYPVLHSKKAPAIGYIIIGSRKIVIPGDVLSVKKAIRDKYWKNADIYIGDGSFLTRDMVRRDKKTGDLYGHSSMIRQIKWCRDANIPIAIFRHYGSEIVKKGIQWAKDKINKLNTYNVKIYLAIDNRVYKSEDLEMKSKDFKDIEPKVIAPIEPRAGIYLVSPHASLIAKGEKKLIVKTKKFTEYIKEPLYLIEDNKCYGIISFPYEPRKITVEEFWKLSDRHKITKAEFKKWNWQGKDLYAYDFTVSIIFPKPREVRIPKGVQVFIKRRNIVFLREELLISLIKGIKYNPKAPNDRQLADDFRICHAWWSSILKGRKLYKKVGDKKIPLTKEIVFDLALTIFKEMIRRGFKFSRPEEYKPGARDLFERLIKEVGEKNVPFKLTFPALPDIDPPYLSRLDNKTLIKLYRYLHSLYEKRKEIHEDLHNAHIFVGVEMYKRGIYFKNRIDDKLTEETELEIIEYPTPRGLVKRKLKVDYLYLEDVLKHFPQSVTVNIPPSEIYIAGRIVNEGRIPVLKDADTGEIIARFREKDIDIIHRGVFDKRVREILTESLPTWLGKLIHYVPDIEGPVMGYSMPLYNKAYTRVTKYKKLSPWQVYELAEIKVGKPFVGLKPRSGLEKFEFFTTKDTWDIWASKNIEKGIVIQRKFDGRRFQLHADKGKDLVKLFTEDRQRDRYKELKEALDELIRKTKAKSFVLDVELEAYDLFGKKVKSANDKVRLGEIIPREDTASFTVGKVPRELLEGAVFQVHDILYLDGKPVNNLGYLDRYKLISKVIPKGLYYWRIPESYVVRNKENFIRMLNKVRKLPGSEGAVLKLVDSIYPIKYTGENRTGDWSKVKNLKELDVMVVKRIPKVTKEGKVLDIYMYECAYIIPANLKDRFYNAFEYEGRWYAPIGRSYSTSVKANKGDIVTIKPIRIRKYEKNGKIVYTWMFPYFDELRKDKKLADTLTTVKRLADLGTAPLPATLEYITKLELCPYWNNPSICPFKERFIYPRLAKREVLKFPVKCRFAYKYKCRYCKEYYYTIEGEEE